MSYKTFIGQISRLTLPERNFFGDIVITFVGVVITAGMSFITQGIAARAFTASDFGKYLTIVRISNVLLPVVMLGMPVALTRYLGLYISKSAVIRLRYTLITAFITCLSFCLLLVSLFVVPLPWIELLLGASTELRFAFVWLLAGLIAYTFAYGFFRGNLRMLPAVIFSILETAAFLLVFLFDPSESPQTIVSRISQIIIVLSFIFLAVGIYKLFTPKLFHVKASNEENIPSYLAITKEVLRYGLPRVPGFIIIGLLFSIGTFFLARAGDMVGTAGLNIGINIIPLVGIISNSIGVVLLPRGSSLIGQGKKADLAVFSKDLLLFGIHLGLFIFFQWLALGSFLIEIFG